MRYNIQSSHTEVIVRRRISCTLPWGITGITEASRGQGGVPYLGGLPGLQRLAVDREVCLTLGDYRDYRG